MIVYAAGGFSYIISATYLPALAAHGGYQLDPVHVFSFFGLCAVPSCFVWLAIDARIGTRRALTVNYGVQASGTMLLMVSSHPAALLGAAAAVGATFMGVVAMSMSAGRRHAPGLTHNLLAILTAAYALGQAAGPAASVLVSGSAISLRMSLGIAAASLMASVAALLMPVRGALQNQRDDLLAFAGQLDAKLAVIAHAFAVPEPLVRQALVLHHLPTTAPACWQGWNRLRVRLGGKFHALGAAVSRAMADTPRSSSMVENLNSRLHSHHSLGHYLPFSALSRTQSSIGHGRLCLAAPLGRAAPSADRLDHPSPEFRRGDHPRSGLRAVDGRNGTAVDHGGQDCAMRVVELGSLTQHQAPHRPAWRREQPEAGTSSLGGRTHLQLAEPAPAFNRALRTARRPAPDTHHAGLRRHLPASGQQDHDRVGSDLARLNQVVSARFSAGSRTPQAPPLILLPSRASDDTGARR